MVDISSVLEACNISESNFVVQVESQLGLVSSGSRLNPWHSAEAASPTRKL